eukprot:339960-Prymnesium_polylepis.1
MGDKQLGGTLVDVAVCARRLCEEASAASAAHAAYYVKHTTLVPLERRLNGEEGEEESEGRHHGHHHCEGRDHPAEARASEDERRRG